MQLTDSERAVFVKLGKASAAKRIFKNKKAKSAYYRALALKRHAKKLSTPTS